MDDEKKMMAGKFCFAMLSLFSTSAFLCGLISTGFCSFAARNIELAEGYTPARACRDIGLDPLSCSVFLEDHGVGFFYWQGTVASTETRCLSYTEYVPLIGYVTPDFDTKFNSAKAMSITGDVMGAFAWFALVMSLCCPISQKRFNLLGIFFFLATLFQGLSLLIMKSSVCQKGFFAPYFKGMRNVTDFDQVVENVSCSLDTGSKLAISSTVFYFLCCFLVPASLVPGPLWEDDEVEAQQQQEGNKDDAGEGN